MPPLLPALAYVTGDLSLLRDDLRPDPTLMALPQGGLTRRSSPPPARSRRRPSSASATAGAGPRRRRGAPICCGSWSTWSAAPAWRSTSPCSRRSSRSAATIAARPSGARPTSRPTSTLRVAVIGAGMSGPAHRAPPRPGRGSTSWSWRRTPTSVAPGTRTGIRAAGSTTPTTTTATRSRSGTTGRCTSPPRTCCSTTSAPAPRVRVARAHPVRHRGACPPRGTTPKARGRWSPAPPTEPRTPCSPTRS